MDRVPHISARLTKAARVLGSRLSLGAKIRYLGDAALGRSAGGYGLRGGGRVRLRPGSTDRKVFDEVFIERVYAAPLAAARGPVDTIADLGANIGLSTVALLRAFPAARAVAVEPDAANFRLLEQNLASAGVAGRCTTIPGFAGARAGFAELVDSGNGAWGLRMGDRTSGGTPVLTLAGIARHAGMDEISILKCDIEGAERELFADLHNWEHLVGYIVLELHADLFPAAEFAAALERSGYEWTLHGRISETSPLSVIGLERKTPRAARRAAAKARLC